MRALLFDLDNTLVDRVAAHRRWAEEWAGPGREQPVQELIREDRLGYRARAEYCAWVARRFPERGLAGAAIWERYRRRLPQLVAPEPSVQRLLNALASRFRLGLVSNGGGVTQRAKLTRAGLSAFFPAPCISGELGIAKPDPAIFARALDALDCAPDEALFVGDHPLHDVGGARAAGLRTCWISLGRSFPAQLTPPDHVVAHVRELPGLLAAGVA